MHTKYYYHAGVETETSHVWSDHTRRSYETAVAEARRLAHKHGGRAIVEYWSREHGLRPADQDLISGADYV